MMWGYYEDKSGSLFFLLVNETKVDLESFSIQYIRIVEMWKCSLSTGGGCFGIFPSMKRNLYASRITI
ncbi:hypothetical protein OPV22_028799 [Ensete ventricosum]|uniref:Uncharacterized protein n=1 Tax=Ensete ventricosum TaxID=4639 RepID=A0AAV8P4F1_ENSVE|nr:hypothetical protein OPV22_028799 [Ensete ventricosum]